MALPQPKTRTRDPICLADVQVPTLSARRVSLGTLAATPAGATARREHCQLSWSLSGALGVPFGTDLRDRVQVRVGVPAGQPGAGSSALYTVAGTFWTLRPEIRFYGDDGRDAGGAAKLFGGRVPPGARVSVWGKAPSVLRPRDFEQPCSPRRHYFEEPSEADPATAGERWFEEWMEKVAAPDLLLMAPHGGEMELETDQQAEETRELLTSANVFPNVWICRGEWTGGAVNRWHIDARDLGTAAFPGLADLLYSRRYRYAVAFHGFSWSPGPGVILGGRACTELKRFLQQQIEVNCAAAGRGGDVAYYLADVDGADESLPADNGNTITPTVARGRKGIDPENLVNRAEVAEHGIQLEQSPGLRQDPVLRQAVARAVATTLYMELHDPLGPVCGR